MIRLIRPGFADLQSVSRIQDKQLVQQFLDSCIDDTCNTEAFEWVNGPNSYEYLQKVRQWTRRDSQELIADALKILAGCRDILEHKEFVEFWTRIYTIPPSSTTTHAFPGDCLHLHVSGAIETHYSRSNYLAAMDLQELIVMQFMNSSADSLDACNALNALTSMYRDYMTRQFKTGYSLPVLAVVLDRICTRFAGEKHILERLMASELFSDPFPDLGSVDEGHTRLRLLVIAKAGAWSLLYVQNAENQFLIDIRTE